MTDEDLRHLWDLRTSYLERIRLLEARQARRGELSSGDALELAQARRDKEAVEASLQLVPPSQEVNDAIGYDGRLAVVEYQIKALSQMFDEGMRSAKTDTSELQRVVTALRRNQHRAARQIKTLGETFGTAVQTLTDLASLTAQIQAEGLERRRTLYLILALVIIGFIVMVLAGK